MVAIKDQIKGWPKWVWRRSGREFCRYEYKDDHGRCCLSGQVSASFALGKRDEVELAIERVLMRRGCTSSEFGGIIEWNDDIAKNLQEIADVWNETMKVELGYIEEFE